MRQKSQLTDPRAIAIASAAFDAMASNGIANAAGSRARTFRSGKEKANDPKRQRKQWRGYYRD